MNVQIDRRVVKVGRHGGSVVTNTEELGLPEDDTVVGRQFLTFPFNEAAVELIVVSTVLDADELAAREKLVAQLNEDILSQVDDEDGEL